MLIFGDLIRNKPYFTSKVKMAKILIRLAVKGILFMCFVTKVTSLNVTFEKMGTLYLPYTYSPTMMYDIGKDAAEQISYDSVAKLLYSVGHTNIHVVDFTFSDGNYNMTVIYHVSYDNVDVTDVELCGNFLFVAFDNETDRMHGFVNVYEAYNRQTNSLNLIHSIIVGAFPDMIHPTSDCSKVLVAIEAEPYNSTQGFIDPPGGIGMITFNTTPADNYTYTVLGFEAFNSRLAELEQSGVRFVYRANKNNFSNDVEPEYIAFNHDQTKAYFSLQENNAIAVVDMQSETIENIFGLGFKNWSATTLDPSDRDGGLNMNPWSVLGMYQPDAIKIWTHNNVEYILTANEGDAKDYPPFFSEETRVGDGHVRLHRDSCNEYWDIHVVSRWSRIAFEFGQTNVIITSSGVKSLADLHFCKDQPETVAKPNATERSRLLEDAHLGRLKITNVNGKNSITGEFDHLYSFGARSFSIWRADNMELVYDSGNDISHRIAIMKPYLFNSNNGPDDTILSSVDSRSDDKGVETESLALAQIGNYTLVMVGNERPGTIAVYSIDNRLETIQPMFVTLLSDIPQVNETWRKVYDERRLSMLDPEDMRFLSESESPNGEPLLLVSGSNSGTISILKVNVETETSGNPSSTTIMKINAGLLIWTAVLAFVNKILF